MLIFFLANSWEFLIFKYFIIVHTSLFDGQSLLCLSDAVLDNISIRFLDLIMMSVSLFLLSRNLLLIWLVKRSCTCLFWSSLIFKRVDGGVGFLQNLFRPFLLVGAYMVTVSSWWSLQNHDILDNSLCIVGLSFSQNVIKDFSSVFVVTIPCESTKKSHLLLNYCISKLSLTMRNHFIFQRWRIFDTSKITAMS